nr:hypothetical protein [uncultured Celeribacter sp.]
MNLSSIGTINLTGSVGTVARFWLVPGHRTFLFLMAAAILWFGSGIATPALTMIGGAVFGAAYVMLAGVYLVSGVRALPKRSTTGQMIAFLTTAASQSTGASTSDCFLAMQVQAPRH